MRNRRTIGDSAVFEGVGIHSGEHSSVRISPLRDDFGVFFKFGEKRYPIKEAKLSDTRRNTTLLFPGGETVQTVEHLLAAVAGMQVDDILVETNGAELPVLDGSALPFAEKIESIGFAEKDEPFKSRSLSTPIAIDTERSSLMALPSDSLRITYVIDYPGTAIGTEMKDVFLTPESFIREVAPARTFGLLSEVEALQRAGLGKGGDLDNVMIIGDDGPLNTVGYRVERECAAHKMLDLLGDLSLAGLPPVAHYICLCGGHEIHSKLVDRLRGLFA